MLDSIFDSIAYSYDSNYFSEIKVEDNVLEVNDIMVLPPGHSLIQTFLEPEED